MEYIFRRDFYDLMIESIEKNTVTFLLGTRKSGKTVCLKQLKRNLSSAVYIDFKAIPKEADKYRVFNDIENAIRNDAECIFLLDEITYVPHVESVIAEIAGMLAEGENVNTKIVFTGSQSVALNTWSNRAFAGNVGKVYVDFLTYSEFLRFKGISEISPDTYNQFLYESADFYKFNSLKEYLTGCLEETIISNVNTSNYIYNNDTYYIENNVDILINICYQTLFTLHNHVSVKSFFQDNKLEKDIVRYFRSILLEAELDQSISERISASFIGNYNNIKSQNINLIKQAFVFLKQCGLITITPVANSIDNVPNVYNELCAEDSNINIKDQLFRRFNITINHPMFYVQILKDILKEDLPKQLPGPLLGSIVECHLRGLLPNGFELHDMDNNDAEVDYVNLVNNLAVEFTISPKHKNNFHILPEYFNCIMLTKNQNGKQGNLEKIDYPRYIYNLSEEKYKS